MLRPGMTSLNPTVVSVLKLKYMSQAEKELIWILNMARMNPTLFASTVVKKYPDEMDNLWLKNVDEYKSLLDTMSRLKP